MSWLASDTPYHSESEVYQNRFRLATIPACWPVRSGKEKIASGGFSLFLRLKAIGWLSAGQLARFSRHFMFIFSASGIVLAFTVCHRLLR
jgi:hypothetical protein